MTDKISKELAKFTDKERQLVKSILLQLRSGELAGLQIVKLRGHDDIFRVKKGRIRIIYQQSKAIKVLVIERRSEKTYRNF
ncbi:MAG: hypothetical protein U0524_03375 [Candidatus Saccharimonadales bacterium]